MGFVGWFSWLVLFGMISWLLCWLVVLGWFFLVGCSWFVFLGLFSRLVFLGWCLVLLVLLVMLVSYFGGLVGWDILGGRLWWVTLVSYSVV